MTIYDVRTSPSHRPQFRPTAIAPTLRGISISVSTGETVALIGHQRQRQKHAHPIAPGPSTLHRLSHARGQTPRPMAAKAIRPPKWHISRNPPTMNPARRCSMPSEWVEHPIGPLSAWNRPATQTSFEISATQLQLDDLLDRPMDQLSGGQRQRVFNWPLPRATARGSAAGRAGYLCGSSSSSGAGPAHPITRKGARHGRAVGIPRSESSRRLRRSAGAIAPTAPSRAKARARKSCGRICLAKCTACDWIA